MLQYRAFRVMAWIVERLPRGLAYALAILVARLAFVFAGRARRRLEVNLRMVRPQASDREIRRLLWLNFRNHAKAYADLMQLPRARVEEIAPLLRTEGAEHLVDAVLIDEEAARSSFQKSLRLQACQDARLHEGLRDRHRVAFAELTEHFQHAVELSVGQQFALLKMLKEFSGVGEDRHGKPPVERRAPDRKTAPLSENRIGDARG